MAKGKVIRIRVSEKLQKRIDQEADNRGMNRSAFIRYCIEKELPNSKEVIIMTREEMATRLKGGRYYVS
jgi:predicted DNA-binding protein